MIATKRRIQAHNDRLDSLHNELTSLNEDLVKCMIGWNVEGITDPTYIEELIFGKRKEIEAEEAKLAEMEAVYEGRDIERQKPWEKKRVEAELFSFC